MMPWESLKVACKLHKLIESQTPWSQTTFGSDTPESSRKPTLHMRKEVDEILANPDDITEYADVLLLLIDAARRRGFVFSDLVQAAIAKHEICKTREWVIVDDPDAPNEHKR